MVKRAAATALPAYEAGRLKAQVGYRKPRYKGGKVAAASENHLKQNFDVRSPNQAWVTDITYIRTYEGWLFLAVVIDLFSRQVVGWSMQPRMHVGSGA